MSAGEIKAPGYQMFDEAFNQVNTGIIHAMVLSLALRGTETLVDVGCGRGLLFNAALSMFREAL